MASHLGKERRVLTREADAEPHRQGRESNGERANDRNHQPKRQPPETPTAAVAELRQLGDRVRGRLHPSRERHPQGQREQHWEESRVDEQRPS